MSIHIYDMLKKIMKSIVSITKKENNLILLLLLSLMRYCEENTILGCLATIFGYPSESFPYELGNYPVHFRPT